MKFYFLPIGQSDNSLFLQTPSNLLGIQYTKGGGGGGVAR